VKQFKELCLIISINLQEYFSAMYILYEDESIIVIDKPSKMMVYPTMMAKNCHWFATKELEKLGYSSIYTIHRLDRPTSGILLFSKNKLMAKHLSLLFRNGEIKKKYSCIVRGHTDSRGIIEKTLKKDGDGELQTAITSYQTLQTFTINAEISRYPQSRFSFLEIEPKTGRMHQIRRHFAHLRHPIIGDKRYGDRHYNKYFKENNNLENMMLHAKSLEFIHPESHKNIIIEAPLAKPFNDLLNYLKINSDEALPPV
jgi:tRNA pseudouridine65 synthase